MSAHVLMGRRYAKAQDATGGWIMTFTVHNKDPYNAIEIGALGVPLCFQVRPAFSSMQHLSCMCMYCCMGHQHAGHYSNSPQQW